METLWKIIEQVMKSIRTTLQKRWQHMGKAIEKQSHSIEKVMGKQRQRRGNALEDN